MAMASTQLSFARMLGLVKALLEWSSMHDMIGLCEAVNPSHVLPCGLFLDMTSRFRFGWITFTA